MAKSDSIIAFQGLPGAHSDMACRAAYPYMDTLPCASFEDVFEAVEQGRAKYGMIPIENSQAGRVAEIHNILPRTPLQIIGEYFQRIHHCVLAPKGATPESIKEVYSHPQALMQCREYTRKQGWQQVHHSNTAAAAADVAKWADTGKAALASKLAAELYGLEVIAENVEDNDENTTVFVVFGREPGDFDTKEGPFLTSVFFVARNIPAALYKALGGFATNGINLVKLESYIQPMEKESAQFFITFEGNPNDRPVQIALEELGFYSRKTRVLGVYPADASRFSDNA